jgi:ABC-type sugar transport system substrate-binding protein
MVMLSAHIEYAAVDKYRDHFARYQSTSANWDPNKQIEDIQDLLAHGPDILLIDPMDTAVVASGVEQAVAADVPVILVSSYLSNAPYVTWLAQSEEERGTACVDWLVHEQAVERILVLSNRPASGANELWLQGVQRQLEAHGSVSARTERCQWSTVGARQATAALLEATTTVDGIVVRDGSIARGAVEAFVDQGLPIPPVAGADDWNGWLRTAKEQGVRFLGLTGSANLGLRAVELAMQVLSGEGAPGYELFPLHAFDHSELDAYYRPDLSEHYWAVHDLPESWVERMFRP